MSNQILRAPEPTLHPVLPGDEHALYRYLDQHWASTMLIRSNLRIGGLVDQGHPTQGTYIAMWDGPTIEGLAVQYGTGALIVHAPRHLGMVAREALAVSGKPLTAIVGPWLQVETIATALGVADRSRLSGTPQVMMTIAIKDTAVPEAVIRENVRGRLAVEADLETLVPWRLARDRETFGLADSPQRRNAVIADMKEQIRVQGLYVAETNRLVAMAGYDVWQREGVQIGGIWVPQALRLKGYGAVAVAEAALGAMGHGVPRAALLVEKAHRSTIASYRHLGFTPVGDYGVLSYTR
jgi:predicted GNAT family acetyltransferase